jgi:hypothetical protein
MGTGFRQADTRQQSLSFALSLVDHFAGQLGLAGETTVTVTEGQKSALRNPSGYYLFTGLTGTQFTVEIRNPYYLEKDVSVAMGALNPRSPVVTVVLFPRYLYPFPAGSTLILGRVTDSDLHPLSKADVAVVGSTVANQTDPDGRFVLYFTSLTDEDVQVQNGRRRITVSGSTTLQLQATKANYQSTTVTIGEVEEGSTKLVRDPILMAAS